MKWERFGSRDLGLILHSFLKHLSYPNNATITSQDISRPGIHLNTLKFYHLRSMWTQLYCERYQGDMLCTQLQLDNVNHFYMTRIIYVI